MKPQKQKPNNSRQLNYKENSYGDDQPSPDRKLANNPADTIHLLNLAREQGIILGRKQAIEDVFKVIDEEITIQDKQIKVSRRPFVYMDYKAELIILKSKLKSMEERK